MSDKNIVYWLELPKSPVSQQDFDEWRLNATDELTKISQKFTTKLQELNAQYQQTSKQLNTLTEGLNTLEHEKWGALGLYKTAAQKEIIERTKGTIQSLIETNKGYGEQAENIKTQQVELTADYNLEGKTQQILTENPHLKLKELGVIFQEKASRVLDEIRQQTEQEKAQKQENLSAQNLEYQQLNQSLKHSEEELLRLKYVRALADLADKGRTPIGTPVEGWIELTRNKDELEKLGLTTEHFTDFKSSDVQARIFKPDPTVFGEDTKEMNAVVVFPPSRLPEISQPLSDIGESIQGIGTDLWNLESPSSRFSDISSSFSKIPDSIAGTVEDWWGTNKGQAFGEETPAYNNAIKLGEVIRERGTVDNIECTGTSLGGGLCAIFSMASGAKATSFNPPGIHENTIGTIDKPIMNNIEVYRIKGEFLANVQNRNSDMNEGLPWWNLKEKAINWIGDTIPEANYGNIHELPEQEGTFDDHGIENVKKALDKQILEKETETKSLQKDLDSLGNQLINSKQSIGMGL